MRIAIDATPICDASGEIGSGVSQYTWFLVSALVAQESEHTFDILVPPAFPRFKEMELLQGRSTVRTWRLPARVPFFSRHLWLPLRLWLKRADVLWSPWGQIPLGWRGKSVITAHDAIIFEHPEWFPEGASQAFSTRVVVPHSFRSADAVIAVSACARDQVKRVFPDLTCPIHVVEEGVEIPTRVDESTLSRFHLPGEVVLYLGTVEPRKNLQNAIRAFEIFLRTKPEYLKTARFVIAGRWGWKTQEVESEIARVNAAFAREVPHGPVAYVGPVSEKEKWALLSRADVFLYPSFEEGFGLPVLEAMAAYTPVVCSAIPALKEVAGESALFVDPLDAEGMALAIMQCLLVPEGTREMRQNAFARARKLTWDRAAKETLRVLESLQQKQPSL